MIWAMNAGGCRIWKSSTGILEEISRASRKIAGDRVYNSEKPLYGIIRKAIYRNN
jgi:hypothetical protein